MNCSNLRRWWNIGLIRFSVVLCACHSCSCFLGMQTREFDLQDMSCHEIMWEDGVYSPLEIGNWHSPCFCGGSTSTEKKAGACLYTARLYAYTIR